MFATGAAEFDDFAGGEDGFEAEDVVGRHAVFQAMRATGIEGDVAADGADGLARRIGRVVETVGRDGEGHGGVDHARLDDGEALGGIDAEDAVEAVERDDETAGNGRGTTGKTRAAAAGDEGNFFGVAESDECDDLGLGFRDGDGERRGAESGEAVALVSGELRGAGEHARGRQNLAEAPQEARRIGGGSDG